MFHLLGHDHAASEEKDEMRELEENVMTVVNLER